MEKRIKQITLYVSNDNKEFLSEKDCKLWEQHLKLDQLHKNLIQCDFHGRCKIRPYYHNTEIKFIGGRNTSKDLSSDNSYILMHGRMGNGNDMVRYKIHGSTIVMLKYSTDSNDQEFLCSIPSSWIDIPVDNLKTEVDKFLENRKIFKKVITNTQLISYMEI
jgi:hypothetical protein